MSRLTGFLIPDQEMPETCEACWLDWLKQEVQDAADGERKGGTSDE